MRRQTLLNIHAASKKLGCASKSFRLRGNKEISAYSRLYYSLGFENAFWGVNANDLPLFVKNSYLLN